MLPPPDPLVLFLRVHFSLCRCRSSVLSQESRLFPKSFLTKDCLLSLSSRDDRNKKVIRIVLLLMFVLKSYRFQKTAVAFFMCDNWMVGIHIVGDYFIITRKL